MPRLTRRRALELAGTAAVAAAVRPAAADAASFTEDVALPAGARIAGARHTLAPVRTPRFDLIGLDFGPAAHVHAQVRARLGDRRWSRWADVHDPTQPVWTGPADTFQVRFTGTARRLRARLTRTGPAPRPAAHAALRAQSDGQPSIILRAGWGGDKVVPRAAPLIGEVDMGFVHHTVTLNDYGPEDSASIVLGIARYHRDHNGWNDIGYNFLVDRYGQIFEGRAGGIELAIVGAQAQGYNSFSTGVSCIGDYTSIPLPADGIDSLTHLLAWKLTLHGVPCKGLVTVTSQGGADNRYAAGRSITFNRISGHRDGDATACPGSALYAQLPTIRNRSAKIAASLAALTIAAPQTEFTYPDGAVELSGLLRFDDDADPTGAQVEIQFQAEPGDEWQTFSGATVNSDGTWAVTVGVGVSGRLRALHPADGIHDEQASFPLVITILPALTLSASPQQLFLGDTTTVSATVQPATVPKGRLVYQRYQRKRWRLVDRHTVRFTDGAWSEPFTPEKPGRYRVCLAVGDVVVRRYFRVT